MTLRLFETPQRPTLLGCLTILAALSAALSAGNSLAAVIISSSATQNMKCSSGVCSPTQAAAVLNVKHLESLLASGDLEITTGSGTLASEVQNIVIAAPITWTSANTLALNAYQSITVQKPVSDDGTGSLTLTTNTGGAGGQLSFSGTGNIGFLATSNAVTINGAAYTLVGDIATLASEIAATPDGNFALANDYDAQVDGTYTESPVTTLFSGNFNGFGHVILNLVVDDPDPQSQQSGGPVGFFAELNGPGSLENVGLKNAKISAGSKDLQGNAGEVGGLVGFNDNGTLFGDSISGSVFGRGWSADVGGLVGFSGGTDALVSNCYSNAIVRNYAAQPRFQPEGAVGGLVGAMGYGQPDGNGAVIESYSTGSVTGGGETAAGGLVGAVNGGNYIGGIITNSFATGNVSAPKGDSGGLVGDLEGDIYGASASVEYSYSTGAVPSVGGGLFEFVYHAGGTDAYWDTVTSGSNQATGSGNIPWATGLTTAQLQSGLPTGFDPTIWTEDPNVNDGLPYLLALPPP